MPCDLYNFFLQAYENFMHNKYNIYTYIVCITILLMLESYLKTGTDKAIGTQNTYINKKMKERI